MSDIKMKIFAFIVWISLLVFPGFTMAQWELQYPRPTDKELEDVSFVDDLNAWATGEKGIILHTSDGGESWEFQESGTELRLRSVFFTDIQNGWIVGGETHPFPGEYVILHTSDGGENWNIQHANSLACLNSVFFTDPDKGWAVGESGAIFHTDNGGMEWIRQYTGAPSDDCEEAFFTDSLNGWIAAESGLYRTTNGGAEWFKQVDMEHFLSVFFINPDEGWATTWTSGYNYAYVLHSTDSFTTWDTVREDLSGDDNSFGYYSVFFRDSDHGWVLSFFCVSGGWSPGCGSDLIRTSDGGNTWQYVELPAETEYNALCFSPEGKGCIVGDHGLVLSATDWEDPWVQNSQGNTSVFLSIDFADPFNGWAVGSDTYDPVWGGWGSSIVHTSDGGSTWQEQSSGITGRVHSIRSVDVHNVWAVGSSYSWDTTYILHTTDGGENWAVQKWDTGYHLMDICFPDESNGWVVGGYSDGCGNSEGKIFKTSNGGISWEEQDCDTCQFLNSVYFINAEVGWTVGKSIYHTQDGGQTWIEQNYDTTGYSLESVFFLDASVGWIAGNNWYHGILLHTIDGGATWTHKLEIKPLFDIHFKDEENGLIASSDGKILFTQDGGITWEEMDTGTDNALYSVFYLPNGQGYAGGGWGTILKSDLLTLTLDEPTPVIQNSELGIQIYPNPSRGIVNLVFTIFDTQSVSLKIYDTHRREVAALLDEKLPTGDHMVRYDVSGLPAGVYFIRLQAGQEALIAKFIKMK